MQDTPDKQQNSAWMIIPGDPWTPGGFRFAPANSGYLNCGRTGVFMIRISNVSTKPLLVDAMTGYGGKEI